MPESTDCKTFRPYQPTPAFVCVRPLNWSIARRARRRPELNGRPCVVVDLVGRNSVVVDASPDAQRAGARVGLSLAEARALCPAILPIDHDAAGDSRALVALGRWMTRFTPLVATGWQPEPGEPPPPPVLLLDMTGTERLFGSNENIARAVNAAMSRFRVPARVTIAPTPGAAWALSLIKPAPAVSDRTRTSSMRLSVDRRSDPTPQGSVWPERRSTEPTVARSSAEVDDTLAQLPVESLRLPLQAVARLRRLGLDTVGQVLAMPRESLSSRFGPSLARRLDQLLGTQAEPLVQLDYDVPVEATMAFDGAIDSLETLWLVLRELVGRVTVDLARRGRGARRVEFTCAPDPSSRWPTAVRSVSLAKPSREAAAIFKLLQCASERLDCGEGFTRVRLRVTVHERVGDEQVALLEDVDARLGRDDWGRLVERLSVRLGAQNVVRPVVVESYIPERAWRGVAMTEDAPGEAKIATPPPPPRPLTLLPTPAEVRVIAEPSDDWEGRPAQFTHGGKVHRLVDVVGPERIAGEWWRGHHKTRDYYDVRDDRGRRFWLFRVVAPIARAAIDGVPRLSTRWFLHGAFAFSVAASVTPSPPYSGERAGVRG